MLDDKVRVAYVLTPTTFGGAEKVSLNFLRTVDRNRFEIYPILLLRPWEDPPYFAREIERLGYNYVTLPVSLKQGGGPARLLRVIWRLFKVIKGGEYDLVHTHGYFADICALPAARILKIKTVTTCHGFIANDNKLKIYNFLNRRAINLCNTVIVVSDGIKDQLIASGVKSDKISVISNAVAINYDPVDFKYRREMKRRALGIDVDEFVVGYLGRLSEEKGVKFLIRAVAQMLNVGSSVKLLIVGDGEQRVALEQQVKDGSLENNVIFAGFQTDVENWLPVFDVFALPSLTEGTPMALLEAMAVGVPIVATSVGGVPKVVADGVNGLLVEPGDSLALKEKLGQLLNDESLRFKMGGSGADTIKEEYSIDKWCRTVEEHYLCI